MGQLQEHSTHIDMEHIEPVRLAQICIPQTDNGLHVQLANEEAVHVPEGELQEHQSFFLNVVVQVGVGATHQVLQLLHHPLNSRLVGCVVVLNAIQQTRDAVVCIGLDFVKERLVDLVPVQLCDLVCM